MPERLSQSVPSAISAWGDERRQIRSYPKIAPYDRGFGRDGPSGTAMSTDSSRSLTTVNMVSQRVQVETEV